VNFPGKSDHFLAEKFYVSVMFTPPLTARLPPLTGTLTLPLTFFSQEVRSAARFGRFDLRYGSKSGSLSGLPVAFCVELEKEL
jgi:hypothetical protein